MIVEIAFGTALSNRVRFDAETHSIAVVLTPKDKENIANMHPDATIYCCFPDSHPVGYVALIQRWLEQLKKEFK
jgi:hypothetical protein